MPRFALILRDTSWDPATMSPEEMNSVLQRYLVWSERIHTLEGNKLADNEGQVLRRNGSGIAVTDGPYVESKEILGGFMIVEAADYAAAVDLCRDSPHFDFGSIEVRRLDLV